MSVQKFVAETGLAASFAAALIGLAPGAMADDNEAAKAPVTQALDQLTDLLNKANGAVNVSTLKVIDFTPDSNPGPLPKSYTGTFSFDGVNGQSMFTIAKCKATPDAQNSGQSPVSCTFSLPRKMQLI